MISNGLFPQDVKYTVDVFKMNYYWPPITQEFVTNNKDNSDFKYTHTKKAKVKLCKNQPYEAELSRKDKE